MAVASSKPTFVQAPVTTPTDLPKPGSGLTSLEIEIVRAVAYSDIFDYPISVKEIQRYLMNVSASQEEVDRSLRAGSLIPNLLATQQGFYTLAGREHIVQTRRERTTKARELWREAIRYGRIIASLPFVRMVAITGELAMDNVGPNSDIDYFIITEPGKLWMTRLMIIAVVRNAALRGFEICPNYFVTERALVIDEQNLYTAHEIAQMVPISGLDTYQRLRDLNPWVDDYLPNAAGPSRYLDNLTFGRQPRLAAESLLRTPAGDWLERWEMNRKVRKLTQDSQAHPESSFTPDQCKGHVDGHGERIIALSQERWREVEVKLQ